MDFNCLKRFSSTLWLVTLGLLLAAGSSLAGDDPSITRVTVHNDGTATIYGAFFHDKDEDDCVALGTPQCKPPVVRIGWGTDDPDATPLTVTYYDDNNITVDLPGDLGPGDYRLSVAHHYNLNPDDGSDDGSSEEKKAAIWDLTVGAVGPQGVQGKLGPQGEQGVQGKLGPQGDQGVQGKLGPQGDQGVQGKLGPQGDQGVQGKLGPQGDQGAQGKLGAQGDQGVQGKLGPQGDQGVQGKLGPAGADGSDGDQGVQGKLGPQGDQGVQGKLGPQGGPGMQGVQGKIGPAGADGSDGDQGVQGKLGPQGEQGPPGPPDPEIAAMVQEAKDAICALYGESNLPPPEFCSYKKVFVSRGGFVPGNTLTSVASADGSCQQEATNAGLGGTFLAWISDSQTSPSARFNMNTGWELVNGTVVADSWADLTDGSLDAAINIDPNGQPIPAPDAWTGTLANGDAGPGPKCGDWTDQSQVAFSGDINATNRTWTENVTPLCSTKLRLYCFEQ